MYEDRIIDLAETPARLSVRHEQLIIEREGEENASVPIADTAALVLSHPRVSLTQSVLRVFMETGGVVIACDERSLPVGMMLPIAQHSTQTERFSAQAAASEPVKKRLWQSVVRAKLKAQARLVLARREHDAGLLNLIPKVRSGDPGNIEAWGAGRYWPALFDDGSFRRRRDADDANRFLNYGYAVLRALVGRAICAAGLHPSLGIHHHNRYDAFCLADDLMEPYRPIVDSLALDIVELYGPTAPMDREAKGILLSMLSRRWVSGGESRRLSDWVSRTVWSVAQAFMGHGDTRAFYPELEEHAEE